jgi:hypothetical protein
LENTDNEFYRADIITDISISDSGISPTRFDNLENGGAYTLYIHHNKNRLRMYIEGQEETAWDFFYADERFYVQIKQFPYYGTWQASEDYKNYLAPDVFEPWPMLTLSEVKAEIARRAPLEAPTHRTTSSLRLRSAQGTTGAIITTLPEGELITVLETGDTAVIDGIRAPWVRVQVRNGSRGWCFSGYLESIAKTEPVTESVFENDAEEAETQSAYFSVSPMLQQKDKMPAYIWFAAGGAVLIAGICVIVIIALKRRKR